MTLTENYHQLSETVVASGDMLTLAPSLPSKCITIPTWLMEGKQFALFVGATYYPAPGWKGFRGVFEELDDAVKEGKDYASDGCGWWQVVNLTSLQVITGEGSGHTGLFGTVNAV